MPKTTALTAAELQESLQEYYQVWQILYEQITSTYEMTEEWHTANKGQSYELKFRRGGKTLVALFPAFSPDRPLGVMVIFGKAEREKFALLAPQLTAETTTAYEAAKTFHDGKWIMFDGTAASLQADLLPMLALKRKPNKKLTDGGEK